MMLQMVRWQQTGPASFEDALQMETRSKKRHKSASFSRRQLVLTLQDPDEEPAATALLATLYGVKPVNELLGALSQEQQLQAALLADMWQMPAVSTAAVQLLVEAAGSDGNGLTAALQNRFNYLDAHPTCLLPLLKGVVAAGLQSGNSPAQRIGVKRLLLSVLGDLEEVWRDEQLHKALLELPLAAMEQLLSFDELKVRSADEVCAQYACTQAAALKQYPCILLAPCCLLLSTKNTLRHSL